MAAAHMDYGGALLRLAAPYAESIVMETSAGDGARGGRGRAGATTAAAHQEQRLLRLALLGGALPGSGGGATTTTAQERHLRQILQGSGGALTLCGGEAAAAQALSGSGGGATMASAHERLVRQILRGGALTSRGGGEEEDAAATAHGRQVRQLLVGCARPIRVGRPTASDHQEDRQLRRLLGLGGALTTSRAGEEAAPDQERQLLLLFGLGGALTGRGRGASTSTTDQGLQMLLLDGAFLRRGPLRLRYVSDNVSFDGNELQVVRPFTPDHFLTEGTTASMAILGVLSRKAALDQADFQLRAIGFQPCSRSRVFLLFIAFGYVSQSSTEMLCFVKKACKFLAKVHDFAVDHLVDMCRLFSQPEFIACMEGMLRVAAQVC